MSFFSPITARSRSARWLFASLYAVLTLGALSIVLPLLVTLSGATTGAYDGRGFSLFPRFLVDDDALWSRYLDARYGGSLDHFKMGWGREQLDFAAVPPPAPEPSERLALWDAFVAEHGAFAAREAGLAFTRSSKREAALENRRFRRWLLAQYDGDLARASTELLIQVSHATNILPPAQARIYSPDIDKPFLRKFREYLETVPPSHRLIWNVGNFYRSVYLPRTYGLDVAAYNGRFGTSYASYRDVPFPATAPAQDRESWFAFVQRVLNPAFVELTPAGRAAQAASGLERADYLRLRAQPEDVAVKSVDTAFVAWAADRGLADARIPQAEIDTRDFDAEKGFWRRQFALQNFVYVLDEVMIQGNGIRNTLILIVLTVLGALTVNPLAAYALSRYRLKQRYQLLLFFLATIAFPAEVAMIPNFLQLKELGLLNTFGALVLPGLVNGFSIFLLKGFFDSLPRELYEAADLDGANEWQIFWGLTMNLSKPILAVIALNAFVAAYGAFFFALILAPDQKMWTLMVWIYQLRQTAGPGIVYASLLITAVPTLIVFLCAQNVILRGIVVPTEK